MNHLKNKSETRLLDCKSILTVAPEQGLMQRIVYMTSLEFPLTAKIVKRSVFKYAEENKIQHLFFETKQLASRAWFSTFLTRHPEISIRKAQSLNPSRAQKLNRFILDDYFANLNAVMTEYGFKTKPHLIYNMNEKGTS